MPEFFKGDDTEQKMYESGRVPIDLIALSLGEFLDGAYGAVPLGELIFDDKRVSITNAIRRDIFSRCFEQLFASWAFCGTFESYILFFQKVFGDSVDIAFTVPDPGKLLIDITAAGLDENPFIAREIVDNAYVFSNVVDQDGNQIVFTTVLGFQTEPELETALKTLVPMGIYTEVSLIIG